MEQSSSWEANTQLVKKSPAFNEPKGSLPCSQEPATGSYLAPDESSPRFLSAFSWDPSIQIFCFSSYIYNESEIHYEPG